MKMIVHDMQEESWHGLGVKLQEKDIVISDAVTCTGSEIESAMESCCQLILISRCVYGGFSPFIQGVMEKCRRHRFWRCGTVRHIMRSRAGIRTHLAWSAASTESISPRRRSSRQGFSLCQTEYHCRRGASRLSFMIQLRSSAS